MPSAESSQIDAVYNAQRLRLAAVVTSGVAAAWAQLHQDRRQAIDHAVQLVGVGQKQVVHLVEAYMMAKAVEATGTAVQVELDPALYTTAKLRGVAAAAIYSRPFGAYGAFINDGAQHADALQAGQASITKLAATDLQLAQTHSARDWMREAAREQQTDELRIVGYRRVLAGPGPHCALCTAAATRTYRVAHLLPIHEHCTCGVQPLWGTEPIASVGTTVRVEHDPEIGPRLMAANWSPVGPRLNV